MDERRKHHPSFLLMRGGPDEELFPKAKLIPQLVRRESVDGGEPSLLSNVFRRSWESEGQTNLLVTGPGGVGKSVALLTFATEEGFLPRDVPAVYIPLYDLAQYHESKRDCIDAYLRSTFPDDERAAIDRLSHKPWDGAPSLILLLDGHNEVPVEARDDVDKGIRKWAGRGGTQVVATSRISSLTGVGNLWQVELNVLGRDEVRSYLAAGGMAVPDEGSNLWQVLETPLMLKLYLDVEAFRHAMGEPYVSLEEPDSAGHLVWNYLQRELWRVVKLNRGGFPKAEYAAALLLTLPYVCWRMESAHEFIVSANRLEEYVTDASRYWATKEKPNRFVTTERRLRSHLGSIGADELAESQIVILSDETGLLIRNGSGYSLLHQNLRDGLAAIHLKNAMEAPYDSLPSEFGRPMSEYVKDFLADVCDDGALGTLWETNRTTLPADTTVTHNLLRTIHKMKHGELSVLGENGQADDQMVLDWSGMDLTDMSLFPYRRGMSLKLAPKRSAFKGTTLAVDCFVTQGHHGPINSICFLEDGRLVSGSDDGTIRFWDVSTGREIGRPLRQGGMVKAVCSSLRGAIIASSSSDARICLWDASKDNAVTSPFQTYKYGARSICLSPPGLLAIGTDRGTVRLIELATGNRDYVLDEGHRSAVLSLDFSPDGALLASASTDGAVRLWDTSNRRQACEPFGGSWGKVLSVRFSPDGTLLASGYGNGSICLWDASSGNRRRAFIKAQGGAVRSICFSPNGKLLASASTDGSVRLWCISTGEQACALQEGTGKKALSLCFSPDGSALICGFANGSMRIWDVSTSRLLVPPIKGHRGWVNTLCFSPDRSLLACGSGDGAVRLWDTSTGAMAAPPLIHGGRVESACFSPDGMVVASSSSDHTVCLWNVHTGDRVVDPLAHPKGVNSICFSHDGATLACGCADGSVYLRDAITGRVSSSPLIHGGLVESVSFSRDDKMLASGSSDHTVRLWDVRTKPSVLNSLEHEGAVRSVCFSPDGSLLASGTSARVVHLWDVSTGEPTRSYGFWRIRTGSRSICFSPNGDVVAAGSSDGSVRLWSLVEGKPLCAPLAHGGRIRSVCFSPDGSVLASSSSDGTVRIWDVHEHTNTVPTREYFLGVIEPLHGIDLTGLDFSAAIIDDPHGREILRQNGVTV